jgi:hypothetical protein
MLASKFGKFMGFGVFESVMDVFLSSTRSILTRFGYALKVSNGARSQATYFDGLAMARGADV